MAMLVLFLFVLAGLHVRFVHCDPDQWSLYRTGQVGEELKDLDLGFQFAFVNINDKFGKTIRGQIVGVYNEAKFLWHPSPYSSLAVFICSNASLPLSQFSTHQDEDPSMISLNSQDISSIQVIEKPGDLVDYRQYMRNNNYTFKRVPLDGEAYILQGWSGYHQWEDGRGTYAWDVSKLNSYMLTYSNTGERLEDFEVFGSDVVLPMSGKIVTAVEKEIDNPPDLVSAVELGDHEDGDGVHLEERPHNLVELEVGGEGSPALLRLLHLQQDSIPQDIYVGTECLEGTKVGRVGNSGTTFVPHLHAVFGFTDHTGRFWSLPIEWNLMEHRILLPYPTGFEYGPYHFHEYFNPKVQYLVREA